MLTLELEYDTHNLYDKVLTRRMCEYSEVKHVLKAIEGAPPGLPHDLIHWHPM